MSILFKFVLLAVIASQVHCEKPSGKVRDLLKKRSTEQQPQPQLIDQSQAQPQVQPQPQLQQAQSLVPQEVATGKSLDNGNAYAGSDLIQQYASAYSPLYAAYPSLASFGPYNPTDGTFSVQSGVDGYIIPAGLDGSRQSTAVVAKDDEDEDKEDSNPLASLLQFLPSFRTFSQIGGRFFSVLLGLLGVTAVGGGVTTALCTYTPLCTIGLGPLLAPIFARSLERSVMKNIDPEVVGQIEQTVDHLKSALVKFNGLQKIAKIEMADATENEIAAPAEPAAAPARK